MTDRTGREPRVTTKYVIKLKHFFTVGRRAHDDSEEYDKIEFEMDIQTDVHYCNK